MSTLDKNDINVKKQKIQRLLEILELVLEGKIYQEIYQEQSAQQHEQDRYVEVTREMAMDACDMRLEGQRWKW